MHIHIHIYTDTYTYTYTYTSRFARRATIDVDAIRVEKVLCSQPSWGLGAGWKVIPVTRSALRCYFEPVLAPKFAEAARKLRGSYAEAESSLARPQHTRMGTSGCLTIVSLPFFPPWRVGYYDKPAAWEQPGAEAGKENSVTRRFRDQKTKNAAYMPSRRPTFLQNCSAKSLSLQRAAAKKRRQSQRLRGEESSFSSTSSSSSASSSPSSDAESA